MLSHLLSNAPPCFHWQTDACLQAKRPSPALKKQLEFEAAELELEEHMAGGPSAYMGHSSRMIHGLEPSENGGTDFEKRWDHFECL